MVADKGQTQFNCLKCLSSRKQLQQHKTSHCSRNAPNLQGELFAELLTEKLLLVETGTFLN